MCEENIFMSWQRLPKKNSSNSPFLLEKSKDRNPPTPFVANATSHSLVELLNVIIE